jgi:hypothetical protein
MIRNNIMSTQQLKKRSLLKNTCSAILILSLSACSVEKDDPIGNSSIIELKVVKTITHDRDLNYVVRSIIYPEDPNTMFLTLRGGGISTYDVSYPANPTLLTHWDEVPCRHVEGQDRIDNLLVVTDISRGGLFLFDVSDPAILVQLSYLNLEGIDNVLHTRIYRANDKMYALFSGGFHFITGEPSDLFGAVDITDPKNPFFVSKIPHYCQMVSEIGDDGILYAALWGGLYSNKGGLAAFDVSDPMSIHELSHVFNKDMAKANRVNIQGDYVFMPLEFENGGGIAIVDRTNPMKLLHVKTVIDIPKVSKPYCLAIKQDYLYLFSSKTNSMVVMQIIKD